MRFLITSAAALLFCLSCASSCSQLPDKHDRGLLASKMINLSAAVDFHFSELPAAPFALDDAELLAAATTHDKLLLAEEFDHYQLKVEYQNAHAVLLLCTKEGQALMEDVGCSARLDRLVSEKNAPCTFTLKVNKDCEVKGGDTE